MKLQTCSDLITTCFLITGEMLYVHVWTTQKTHWGHIWDPITLNTQLLHTISRCLLCVYSGKVAKCIKKKERRRGKEGRKEGRKEGHTSTDREREEPWGEVRQEKEGFMAPGCRGWRSGEVGDDSTFGIPYIWFNWPTVTYSFTMATHTYTHAHTHTHTRTHTHTHTHTHTQEGEEKDGQKWKHTSFSKTGSRRQTCWVHLVTFCIMKVWGKDTHSIGHNYTLNIRVGLRLGANHILTHVLLGTNQNLFRTSDILDSYHSWLCWETLHVDAGEDKQRKRCMYKNKYPATSVVQENAATLYEFTSEWGEE